MLGCVMLFCAMLCDAVLHCPTLCSEMLCYAILCCAMLCCAILCCAMLRYAVPYHSHNNHNRHPVMHLDRHRNSRRRCACSSNVAQPLATIIAAHVNHYWILAMDPATVASMTLTDRLYVGDTNYRLGVT